MDATENLIPPVEVNRHEVGMRLLWDRIQIAIDQMPVPVEEADNMKLKDAEEKMWSVLEALGH